MLDEDILKEVHHLKMLPLPRRPKDIYVEMGKMVTYSATTIESEDTVQKIIIN